MQNEVMEKISAYVDAHADEFVSELQEFLRQPSISTENIGMEECIALLQNELDDLAMPNKMLTLDGAFPALFGTIESAEKPKKELLVYGHYDVQSPDPVHKWTSDPFSAEIRDGMIYARGATDDKGNLFATIKAAGVLKKVLGYLPAGLKLFFEGEEEIGSPNLAAYLKEYASTLSCDGAIICDRGVHESGRPQMYLGNKGLLEVEISCKRAKRDVHSGHAPLIPNAIWDLVRLLNSMKNELDVITIDHYLDGVIPPSQEALELISNIPYDLEQFKHEYGISEILGGEGSAEAVIERLLYTPTCNISGVKGGWAGERGKTIVPCEAWCRVDFRLVNGLTTSDARELVRKFVEASPYGPFTLKMRGHNEPYTCSPSHELVQLCARIATDVYGGAPVIWPLLDGSGPMCMFPRYLGGEVFILGLGAPFSTANTHAPDENISICQYLTGIKQMANLYYQYLL